MLDDIRNICGLKIVYLNIWSFVYKIDFLCFEGIDSKIVDILILFEIWLDGNIYDIEINFFGFVCVC